MTPEAVHVPVAGGNAAITHDDRDLVQSLREQVQKVPVVLALRRLVRGSRFTA
jgi:hypothetical protein